MRVDALTTYSEPIERAERHFKPEAEGESSGAKQPTFLDVFTNIYGNAVSMTDQKNQDMINLMLGETDDIAQVQLNAQKAQFAVEMFVAVKNTVYEAYNEIIRMNI